MQKLRILGLGIAFLGLILTGCDSMNRTQKGGLIGAGAGAAVGGIIGAVAKNPALGAVIGATVGGAAGAVIGKQMDKQAQEIKNEVPGAKVERVEEGIVVEFSSKILFGFDQSNLTPDAQKGLQDLIKILQKYPDTDLEIQGHTDNSGTAKYNQGLSERRASSVANFLGSNGIALERMHTVGFGLTQPKYDNNTADGRTQNRRVEFIITANEKMKQDATQQSGK